MNNAEALAVLAEHLDTYRKLSYAELAALVDEAKTTFDVAGPSGVTYQIEVQAAWDDRKTGNVRILGAVDDGGWRAFFPLSDSFVIAPSGAFVGE
jgi:hypothetical protein